MKVDLYGDRHNSEEYAAKIHKTLASTRIEAIMFESPDLKGERIEYLLKAFKTFPTLAHVYNAFNLDVTKKEEVEDRYKSPLYKLRVGKLEEALEALFKVFDISASVEEIISPGEIVIGREEDLAITSLFRTLMFKKNSRKNTLLPRIGVIIRNFDAEVYTIDLPQDKVYASAAKNIANAPSTASGVNALMNKARKGQASRKEASVANEILNKTSSAREEYMAKQITQIMQSNNYSLGAAIMGRSHVSPVKLRLKKKGVKSIIQVK